MFAAGVVLLGFAAWTDRNRDGPALRPFVLFVVAVGTLAVVDGLAAGTLWSLSIVWVTAFLAIPCAFTWFVVEYYGLPHLASSERKAAFVAPAVVGIVGGAALVLSPSASGSMAGGGPTTPAIPSLLGFAGLAEQAGIYYAGGVMLAGVALLARTVSNYEYLDGRLGVTLSFIAVWPWAAYFVTPGIAGDVPFEGIIGLTASGYVLSAGAVGFAVTRGGLFDAAPAAGTLGAETVLGELDDAVVVVDHDQRVVKLNAAAAETFGVDPDAVAAEPLSDAVGADLEALREPETVELTVPEGTRHFEASVSPVRDRYDRQPGHAVVITDVTRERLRSQRLAVLNRVLRHNLRNGMTNIMGRAEIIAEDDGEHANSAEMILTSADDLMSLGERARQVEKMMAVTPEIDEVGFADVAENVLDGYRTEYRGARRPLHPVARPRQPRRKRAGPQRRTDAGRHGQRPPYRRRRPAGRLGQRTRVARTRTGRHRGRERGVARTRKRARALGGQVGSGSPRRRVGVQRQRTPRDRRHYRPPHGSPTRTARPGGRRGRLIGRRARLVRTRADE